MASYTEHLNLLKKNPATDGADTFNIETMLNENWDKIDEAVAKKAELGADGKVSAEQLPEMNYDKAGSAAAVQKNLDAHTGNRSNPHGVTASQVGARADTWVPSWGEVSGKPGTFPPSGHNHDASNIVSGILPVGRGGTGVTSLSALAAQIAANGGCRIATGSYVGTGNFGSASPTSIQLPFPAKYVGILTVKVNSDQTLYNEISHILIASVPTNQYSPVTSGDGPFGRGTAYQYNSSQNILSWYSTQSAAEQQNSTGQTFYWIAFG